MAVTNNQTFQIGQMIFVCSNKTGTVIPGIVNEEILHKTREGNFVSYKVLLGSPNKQRVLDLVKIDGDVFGSVEEMRDSLIQKLNDYVQNTCDEAVARATAWYGDSTEPQTAAGSGDKIDPQSLMNEIGGSTNHSQQQYPNQQNNHPIQAMRNRMVDPTLLEREVILEDGSSKKISINLNPKE